MKGYRKCFVGLINTALVTMKGNIKCFLACNNTALVTMKGYIKCFLACNNTALVKMKGCFKIVFVAYNKQHSSKEEWIHKMFPCLQQTSLQCTWRDTLNVLLPTNNVLIKKKGCIKCYLFCNKHLSSTMKVYIKCFLVFNKHNSRSDEGI